MELEDASKETEKEPAVPAESQIPSEFEKLFKGCEDNPEDFNGWVYLLQYVEQEVSRHYPRQGLVKPYSVVSIIMSWED